MANTVPIIIDNPDQILNTGAYAAGAVIRLQSATSATGVFADVAGTGSTPTIAVVTLTTSYTGYDPAGTSTTWYRTRIENAGGTRLSDWSTPVLVGTRDLVSELALALRDTSYATWTFEEMTDLITWSVASLWPRFKVEMAPQSNTIALVDSTYFYSLPTGMLRVSAVDWLDTDSTERGTLSPGVWSTEGPEGSAKIHVAPVIADQGGTLRLLGYGRYDLVSNFIPDDLVPLVLAMARAEAYRRMAGSRVQFTQWLASNQSANVTVNELDQLIREANAEINRLQSQSNGRTWSRPTSARRG